ncbi:uncharacterized protein [Aegilops tauschii subsp. strangulata]|uniref:uncharacterized protein n=1 Tax=Aegilops tauschii subsp. strangulata TaxID=200361 RepID=UPI003CC8B0C4
MREYMNYNLNQDHNMVMGHMTRLALAHTDLALEAVVQVLVFKDKVVRGALTSSPTRLSQLCRDIYDDQSSQLYGAVRITHLELIIWLKMPGRKGTITVHGDRKIGLECEEGDAAKKETLLDDLKETFDNLRIYKMMPNLAKCVFGMPAAKLLGFLVSERGIEANLEKIKAITSLAKPACVNDVQRLAGRIAALSQFISRLGEKAIPLYQMMTKIDQFFWSDAANEAFKALKKQLAEPPVLAAPIEKEPLLLYVAANRRAVSVAVVVERKDPGKEYLVQRPAYYVSEVLIESKQRYPHWQKLVYAVFMASRKLQQYFLGHPNIVVSSAPLGDIIQNREATGRVANWDIELGPHGLKYTPRTTIKSQALVDFINDWTELQMREDKPYNTYRTIHFDGSRQLERSGAGVILTSPHGDKFGYVLRLMFPCSNNAAEYEASLHGLHMAKEMNLSRVRCFGDSDLVAQQVSGSWDSKDPLMVAYRRAVDAIAGHFKGYQVEHIDRRKNEAADALC